MPRVGCVAASVFGWMLAVQPALAQRTVLRGPDAAPADTSVPSGNLGLRGALDPVTGQLVEPLPDRQLAPMVTDAPGAEPAIGAQDFSRVRMEVLPDGRIHADVQGQFNMASFARIGATGTVETWCKPHAAGDVAHSHTHARDEPDAAASTASAR